MRKIFLFIIFFIFIGCSNQEKINQSFKSSVKTSKKIKREALIIGVGKYYGDNLQGVDSDIYNISKILRKWHFNTTSLMNSEAIMIIDKLERYQSLTPDDIFIFYFSGYGFHVPDRSGDEKDGEDNTVAFSDTKRNFLLLDDSLFGYLNKIKAKKLIIIDASYNRENFIDSNGRVQPKALSDGSQYQILKSDSFKPEESILNGGKYIMLSSSKDNQLSYSTPKGSLFTNALIESLKEGYANGRLVELKSNIDKNLKKYYNRVGYMQSSDISLSSQDLENISLKDFLNLKDK
jgi:hypothetical protein